MFSLAQLKDWKQRETASLAPLKVQKMYLATTPTLSDSHALFTVCSCQYNMEIRLLLQVLTDSLMLYYFTFIQLIKG